MFNLLTQIDRILRGEATRLTDLRSGNVPISAGPVALIVVLLGMLYGFFMGWYALINRPEPVYWQLLATSIKVPALFWLTLLVTFPSLYVFNALVGSRLRLVAVFKLLLAAMGVALAVLASFGPITAFFSITTENYSFMVLLNVLLFSVAGFLGLGFLLRTLQRMSVVSAYPMPECLSSEETAQPDDNDDDDDEAEASPEVLGALDPLEDQGVTRSVRLVFFCWVVIYSLVGAQMSWILRPFIGSPASPFEWFRERDSNFFEAVAGTLGTLLGG